MGPNRRWRVLTDLSGPFDTVIQEVEAESLAEWEQARAKLFGLPSFRESMSRMQGMIVSGRNELWTVEGEASRGSPRREHAPDRPLTRAAGDRFSCWRAATQTASTGSEARPPGQCSPRGHSPDSLKIAGGT